MERLFDADYRSMLLALTDALWTIQEVAEFRRESSDWEFAWALKRPGVEWWLETARRLVDGRVGDEKSGLARRPGLLDHQRLLAEIRLDALPARSDELDAAGERIAWSFDDREKRWWNEQLTKLESGLLELRNRIELAERCATTTDAQRLWSEARAAIKAHPEYGGLEVGPQLCLLPLGPDSESGLWEFAHLLTGEPAVRGADDKLVLSDNTGLVFVLLPGGRLPVEDGKEPGPLNAIDLASFFLSKYEMTRGQWTRISAGWTGRFRGEMTPLHPADNVSWDDCQEHLGRLPGWLRLPSEVQWEYGCRAGTTTPWWTGADAKSLRGAANIRGLDDRTYDYSLPVGTLRANPFGLHGVHGNLREWCQETYDKKVIPRRVYGLRNEAGPRVYRGGSFDFTVEFARSAYRSGGTPEIRIGRNGLRPASPLTP